MNSCTTLGFNSLNNDQADLIRNESKNRPQFYVETINIAKPDQDNKNTLLILINLPFSELIFQKNNNGWQGSFDTWARLNSYGTKQTYVIFQDTTMTILNYLTTKNKNISALRLVEYNGQSGNQLLDIKVIDNLSNQSSNLNLLFNVRSIRSNKFNISDPLFISENAQKRISPTLFDPKTNQLMIAPINSQKLNPWHPLNFIFEIYYPDQLMDSLLTKQVVVEYKLLCKNKPVLEKKEIIKITAQTKNRELVDFQFSLPDNLGSGNYQLILQAFIQNKETGAVELTSHRVVKPINFISSAPKSKQEINKILGPLAYIAPSSVIKKLKKAKTEKEKAEIFMNFWQPRGLEQMKEFYDRVEYVNKQFSSHNKGWKTDRGKVYIKFGPADAEEYRLASPRAMEGPMLIWHYYNFLSNSPYSIYRYKTFIFVDKFGVDAYTFGKNDNLWHNLQEFNN